jgi:hypothetical protein
MGQGWRGNSLDGSAFTVGCAKFNSGEEFLEFSRFYGIWNLGCIARYEAFRHGI